MIHLLCKKIDCDEIDTNHLKIKLESILIALMSLTLMVDVDIPNHGNNKMRH